MAYCRIHKTTKLITFCPKCRGGGTSAAKAEASRQNGLLGGRPKLPAHNRFLHNEVNDPKFRKIIKNCAGCIARAKR